VLHESLIQISKFVLFVVNVLIKEEIEKPCGQYLGLNLNPRGFYGFTFILISYGESYLLVSWCACDRCGMAGNDEHHGRSRRPGVENRGWSGIGRVLGGRTIERSGDAVCGLHHAREDDEHEFLG
jgi:hypothetical protein